MVAAVADSVGESRAYCRGVARRAGSSFPLAFRLLPAPKRDAMTALYAFMRVTDDLADEPGEVAVKRLALKEWRRALCDAVEAGRPTHPCHAALAAAVARHAIPVCHLVEVIDGVEMDLEPLAFRQFGELRAYCHKVASAVGLACVPVWGLRPGFTVEEATPPAEAAGVAFQLTNILRDVAEDQERGRVYLPAEDLAAFGVSPESWRDAANREQFRELMRFQADRTRDYYDSARGLEPMLSREGRAIYGAMTRVYRGILAEIEARGFDVFAGRVRLSRGRKAWAVARALPVRWGLL